MTIMRKRIACWMPKASDTYAEYVILIAFPLQKRFARTHLSITLCTFLVSVPLSSLFLFE